MFCDGCVRGYDGLCVRGYDGLAALLAERARDGDGFGGGVTAAIFFYQISDDALFNTVGLAAGALLRLLTVPGEVLGWSAVDGAVLVVDGSVGLR